MNIQRSLIGLFVLALASAAATASAADHRVEPLNEAPPADAISAEIAATLSPSGVRVIRGESRTVCDIWLCKEWEVTPGDPPLGVNYPFKPGHLIGVARYPRRGGDFRDQDIDEGVYTLRYAQQPVDGNHVGTSPTRDFLLLVNAENDKSAKPWEYENLTQSSAEAAESSHPCLLSLQRVSGDGEAPTIRHEEQHDWWIVGVKSKAKADDRTSDLRIDLVVVGYAAE